MGGNHGEVCSREIFLELIVSPSNNYLYLECCFYYDYICGISFCYISKSLNENNSAGYKFEIRYQTNFGVQQNVYWLIIYLVIFEATKF